MTVSYRHGSRLGRLLPPLFTVPVFAFAGLTTGHAQVSAQTARAKSVPIVATWFGVLRPHAGSRETIHIEFSRGGHGVAHAHFKAKVAYGKQSFHLSGPDTDGRGRAAVAFTVPHRAAGETLHAFATVTYKAHHYRGSNHVSVRG